MSPKARGNLFLAVGLLAGVVAALLTRELVKRSNERMQAPPPAPVVQTEPVIVAADALAAGEAVPEADVSVVAWPKDFLPPGRFASAKEIEGRVLRRPIQKGEPILESALAPKGVGAGLGSLIESDRRAMAVKVDPVVIVAGFVKPGSRVDVIATMRRERNALPYSGVILQDLKVLAIDQKLEQGSTAEAQLGSVVTLEVTPYEAQRLAYAAKEGSLQLTLRGMGDARITELPGITGRDVIPEPEPPGTRKGDDRIETIRGIDLEQVAL